MMTVTDLPDDIDALKAIIPALQAEIVNRDTELVDRDVIIERKEDRIQKLESWSPISSVPCFGAKSEKTAPEQYELALEDIETAMVVVHAEDGADQPATGPTKPRKANRGSLPIHLPRIEVVIDPEEPPAAAGPRAM